MDIGNQNHESKSKSRQVPMQRRMALQELEIPPRPTLTLGGKEPYRGHGPFHGFDRNAPKFFRLTWTLSLDRYHAEIDRYEIFACTQKVKSASISKWMRIAEVKAQKKHCDMGKKRLAVSKRMNGFDEGFRYQIVVRGVDNLGREGPFSKPVDVILPPTDFFSASDDYNC